MIHDGRLVRALIATSRASYWTSGLARVVRQETQCLFVELGRVLVDRRVRAGLEHDQLAAYDTVLHRVCETSRAYHIVPAECDLRRRLYARELGHRVMGNYRARLADEGIERLPWIANTTFASRGRRYSPCARSRPGGASGKRRFERMKRIPRWDLYAMTKI